MYTLRQNALFTDEIELQKNDGTSEILKIKIDIRPKFGSWICKSVPTVTPET